MSELVIIPRSLRPMVERQLGRELLEVVALATKGVKVAIPIAHPALRGFIAYDGHILAPISGGAFTSYSDIVAEIAAGKSLPLPFSKNPTTAPVAANWYHLWPVGGMPGQGVLYTGTSRAHQRTTQANAGALYHGGDKAADTKHVLSFLGLASAGVPPPMLMLVDQVGYYPDTQSAGSVSFDNTTGPDRYIAAGEGGLQCSLVNAAAGGATASNLTVLTYVDQDGNAGALMPTTPAVAVTVSTALPSATLGARVITTIAGPFLPLAAGDGGIRSLTNRTFSAANTGLEAFVMVRPLAYLPLRTALVAEEVDLVQDIVNLPRVIDGACLAAMVFFPVATGAVVTGRLFVAWG